MTGSAKMPGNRKAAQVIFLIALLAVPAVLFWLYSSPQPEGDPTFETMQSESEIEAKTPLQTMEDMWQHHPGHGPIALELANLYFEDGQYQKAIEFYNIFLQDDTTATGWHVRLDMSRAYVALAKADSALLELNKMLERDPNHPGALYNIGAIQANGGNFSAARAAWERLIQSHPEDTLAVFAKNSLPRLSKPDGHP